jgi:hypothetical protein
VEVADKGRGWGMQAKKGQLHCMTSEVCACRPALLPPSTDCCPTVLPLLTAAAVPTLLSTYTAAAPAAPPPSPPCAPKGTRVTLLDANHCPGSAMILAEPAGGGPPVLHTGEGRERGQRAGGHVPIYGGVLGANMCTLGWACCHTRAAAALQPRAYHVSVICIQCWMLCTPPGCGLWAGPGDAWLSLSSVSGL